MTELKQGKYSLNHDSPDLIDSPDFKNQGNQHNQKNQGSDNRKGWEVKKLVDISSHLGDGLHGTPKYSIDGDYYFINGNNLTDGLIEFKESTKRVSIDEYKKYKKNLTDRTILVSINGTLGNVAFYNNEKIILGKSACYFNLLESVDKSFIKYILSSPYFLDYAHKEATGATIKNVSLKTIREFEIPTPPLPEQQRIVSILDEAFAAIAKAKTNAEQNLKNAKELFESYLQGVFENKGEGWEEKTLEQISKTFGRGKSKHRPRNFAGLYGGDYPFIQTGDIRNCDHFVTDYTQTYNEVGLAQSKLWPTGTICITIAANIAETGILTFDACFPDSVIGIVVNEKFADRDFVEYLLQSFKVRIQALGKGSAQANINMGTFENEHFPFPPLKTQQTIVQKLDALSAETKRLEAIYRQKMLDLDELKKSVLQKAFNGEL
ncbi:MAG: restriction endonuclease subunit S [Paludibacter sp.]|nr:restriction endonuclease subunit S [Paludibacter sp.]